MTTPADWVRPEILALTPYKVADASGLIKLDAMENPYDFPAELRQAWLERLQSAPLNRYPDASADSLKGRIRECMAFPDDAVLMLGNGSDEILQVLMLALARPGAKLVTPEPGFAMFRLISQAAGLEDIGVPLGKDFELDAEALLESIESQQPALVIIAQPNNPTGNAFAEEDLRRVVEAAPGLVVVDEAYYPFAASDCLKWLSDYPNLLIMRTLSKLGLAGLRLGLLAGHADWINALEPLRLPYNINCLTQLSAEFALEHYDAFTAQAQEICDERSRVASELNTLPQLTVYPSQANFLLLRVPQGQADTLHAGLRAAGILVKNLHGAHPQVADCLRLTIGTRQQNEQLTSALRELL